VKHFVLIASVITTLCVNASDSDWQRVKRLNLKSGVIYEGMPTKRFDRVVPHGFPRGMPNYVTSRQSSPIEGRPYALADDCLFCQVGNTEFQVLITSPQGRGYHSEVGGIWVKNIQKNK